MSFCLGTSLRSSPQYALPHNPLRRQGGIHRTVTDHVVYIELNDAPSQLDWLPSALTTSWLEHFHEREGGRDKAEAIARRYIDLVAQCKHDLAIATF